MLRIQGQSYLSEVISRTILFFLCSSLLSLSQAQAQWNKEDTVYAYNYWIDIPVTLAGHAFNLYGQEVLRELPKLKPEDYQNLSPEDVNPFDRIAARQDPDFADQAHDLSDLGLTIAPALPLFLVFDRQIRGNFLNYSLLYLEMHAINATLYLAAALPIRRIRPFVYNPEEKTERKEGIKTTDSFFSGHVSVVTASTFFMVKVLSDYHPELRRKRFLLYGLATLPSLYTGYFRMKAGKHFPTDLIVGYVIGAATGILVPQAHKSKWFRNLAIGPMLHPGATGLNLAYQF